MNKLSPLQLILMIVAGFGIIIAVMIFSFSRNNNSSDSSTVVMWGTVDADVFTRVVQELSDEDLDLSYIQYEQHRPETIDDEFVQALAEGAGPDLIMINQDQIIKNEKRLIAVPFESLPLREFLDTFIPAAELFVGKEGIIAIPFMVDPMIMYWNRTLFSKSGIATPPRYWTEVMELTPRLTVSNSELQIEESAIALGEFRNLTHAKQILMNLILQAGNSIIVRDSGTIDDPREFTVTLSDRLGYTVAPTTAALNFFTQFANPSRDIYSWNRSLPMSQTYFLAGDLAMYLGFASELSSIREQNPNLDFDITTVPQSQSSTDRKVFGNMAALGISRASADPQTAFKAATELASAQAQAAFAEETGLPPVRRELLQADPADRYEGILYTSALWTRGILEIEREQTAPILQSMVESFVTGQLAVDDAIDRAQQEFEILLNK